MNTLSKLFTTVIISATALVCLQGCTKSKSSTPTPTATTTNPIATFTCLVDGNTFTVSKLNCSINGNITIIAIDSTASGVQEIYISLALRNGGYPSNSVGTPYSLAAAASNASVNGATYGVGSNTSNLSNYFAQTFSPGTLTITKNVMAAAYTTLATGTFSFQGYAGSSYHTITNGSFANISIVN